MDFELREAGRSFLAGAFSILAFIAVARYGLGYLRVRSLRRAWRTATGSSNGALITGLFVAFSFALGLLIEDGGAELADRYVFWPYHWTNPEQYSRDHSHSDEKIEGRLQQAVLFESVWRTDPNETSLGQAVMRSRLFSRVLGAEGCEIETWSNNAAISLAHSTDETTDGIRVKRISQVFFFAKNRLYLLEPYGEELRRIDSRQEFSSTIATVSLLAFLAVTTGGLSRVIYYRKRKRLRRYVFRRAGMAALTFAAIYVLAFVAFIHESEEFNRRVFGYYDSMLHAARAANAADQKQTLLP